MFRNKYNYIYSETSPKFLTITNLMKTSSPTAYTTGALFDHAYKLKRK